MSWKGYEVADGIDYRIHLCQIPSGLRFFRLAADNSEANKFRSEDVFFSTNIVPNDLLKQVNIRLIVKLIKLENGEHFFVDAHNTWLTFSEIQQLQADIPASRIKWSTGIPPSFAPK